jgi:hypothetical protein
MAFGKVRFAVKQLWMLAQLQLNSAAADMGMLLVTRGMQILRK